MFAVGRSSWLSPSLQRDFGAILQCRQHALQPWSAVGTWLSLLFQMDKLQFQSGFTNFLSMQNPSEYFRVKTSHLWVWEGKEKVWARSMHRLWGKYPGKAARLTPEATGVPAEHLALCGSQPGRQVRQPCGTKAGNSCEWKRKEATCRRKRTGTADRASAKGTGV